VRPVLSAVGEKCYNPSAMPPESSGALEERILRRIPVEIIAVAAVLALAAILFFDPLTGIIFFAGGAFAAFGFAWLKRSLTRFLSSETKGALRSGIVLYGLRIILICAVFSLIIFLYPKKIIAFAAGFSTIIPVSLAEGIRGLLLMRTWKG
jgi:hypothetical protein